MTTYYVLEFSLGGLQDDMMSDVLSHSIGVFSSIEKAREAGDRAKKSYNAYDRPNYFITPCELDQLVL